MLAVLRTAGRICASQASRRTTEGASTAPVSNSPTARSRRSASKSTVTVSCAGWPPRAGSSVVRNASRQTSTSASARRAAGLRRSGPSRRTGPDRGPTAASMIAAPSTSKMPDSRIPPSPSGDRVNPRRCSACRCSRSSRSRSVRSANSGSTWASTRSPRRRRIVGSNWPAWPTSTASTLSTSTGSSGTSANTRPIAAA